MEALRRPGAPEPRPSVSPSGEFLMTADDLRGITERGQRRLGIELGESKRQMVYSRLSRRLRALGMETFAEYLEFLDSPAGCMEYELFSNALTTNLTAFFREAHHFEHFEREIRRPVAARKHRLRVWSAGCSTGEEAYSIAMVLHANADVLGGCDRRVLATDVDTEVLAFASRAEYPTARLRGLPTRFRTSTFLEMGEESAVISETVRNLVIYRTLNLIGSWPFKGRFDFVFCRNVLIYFSPETRDRIISQLADLLRPGGVLYLGHSESVHANHPVLRSAGQTIYRRGEA